MTYKWLSIHFKSLMINQRRTPKNPQPKHRCGCQASCKGFPKLVSLSTYNRHQRHRNEESFSIKFRGFLTSALTGFDEDLQRGTTSNNIPESEAAHQVPDAEVDRSMTDAGGDEERNIGTRMEGLQEESQPANSNNVRLYISLLRPGVTHL
jgi:hypothetical protein